MNIIDTRHALILGLIMIPLGITAGPTSITLTNQSGEPANFEIILEENEIKTTPEIADLRSKKFQFKKEIIGIRNRNNTAIALDVSQYSELITVIYDGNVLLEESAYKLSQQSPIREKITVLRQTIAANLAVAWQSGGAILQGIWAAWKQRSSSKPTVSPLAQGRVYNTLDFPVAYSAGNVQYKKPSVIEPNNSDTFGLKGKPHLYVYNTNDSNNAILTINLQKYIDNPKSNADLEITLQKRYALSKRVFEWMSWWMPHVQPDFTYSVRWVAQEQFNIEDNE